MRKSLLINLLLCLSLSIPLVLFLWRILTNTDGINKPRQIYLARSTQRGPGMISPCVLLIVLTGRSSWCKPTYPQGRQKTAPSIGSELIFCVCDSDSSDAGPCLPGPVELLSFLSCLSFMELISFLLSSLLCHLLAPLPTHRVWLSWLMFQSEFSLEIRNHSRHFKPQVI